MEYYNVSFPRIGIELNFSSIAFKVFSLEIRWYAIVIVIAIFLSMIYAIKKARSLNLDSEKFFDIIMVSVIAAIIGARLYYILFFRGNFYIKHPLDVFNIRQGGLAIYGAIIAGFISTLIMSSLKKLNLALVLDILCVSLLLGQSIGRWGNFFNQEAYGTETTLLWGMKSEATFDLCVHPCFLYESLWCFLGFLLLHQFSKKFKKYDGQVALLYFIWYGLGRFFIEALRTDSLYFFGTGMKISQSIAAVSILVAITLLLILNYKNRIYFNAKRSS